MTRHCIAFLWIAAVGFAPAAHGMETSSRPADKEIALKTGSVAVYRFGDAILHAYQTGDALADECFALETPTRVIAIESPPFEENIEEWKNYVAGLGKPLTDVLIAFHPAGGKWYGDAVSHATAPANKAIAEGATRKLSAELRKAFGDAFSGDIVEIDHIFPAGTNTVGGLTLEISDDGDGYDIAIPALKAVYVHMLGADVHSILVSQAHMDAEIAKLERFVRDGYSLFLSSHHTPETAADAQTKIAYIKKIKALAAAGANSDDFVKKANQEFPGFAGGNYLGMTAAALFGK